LMMLIKNLRKDTDFKKCRIVVLFILLTNLASL